MIQLVNGLKNSLIVLEHLRNDEDLNEFHISVGTFTNCRECGLTFKVMEKGGDFTWCVYEHRGSDEIIINGKKGYVSLNGDLPYMADSSSKYLASFSYNEHLECADELARLITEWMNKNRESK